MQIREAWAPTATSAPQLRIRLRHVTPGPGKTVQIRNSAASPERLHHPGPAELNLQPVDQGDAPTNNDNARIGNPPQPTGLDPCTDCNGIDWDPSTRMLSLRNNSTLTLGGSVYSFCGIEIENTAQLKIPARPLGTGIRIFIDSPDNAAERARDRSRYATAPRS